MSSYLDAVNRGPSSNLHTYNTEKGGWDSSPPHASSKNETRTSTLKASATPFIP